MIKAKTTCAYCGVGCGVEIEQHGQRLKSICGDQQHPANHGRLCIKGAKLLQTTALDGRLLAPKLLGEEASWGTATAYVADRFSDIIREHGPDSVAFYVSGQLLTEDYYVANKLMKGFIGSANIDTNSRLCMSSAVAGYKRAFGEDVVPCCYEDLENTDLIVFVGSNAAWTHPVLFQRMEAAKANNPSLRFINIDPRETATSTLCDLHLAIKPGTDVALFNGLLTYLNEHDYLQQDFLEQHTEGFEQALISANLPIEQTAKYCDISIQDLTDFYQLFAQSERAISFYSMGVNQSIQGVDKTNAIINCHLATGKIGKEGCGPFSITGQPNAMGGREVGGLANMLAAHMDINNPEHRNHVQSFWQSPVMANKEGLKAVDLFEQIEQGKVKAVWVMATNPLVSMPNRNKIERALKKCELVVVSDCVEKNDTLDFAHVAFPAAAWSEKDGTVTNSERCISRQRGLVNLPGQAKYDWQIICDIADKMGFTESFSYDHVGQIFDEHARLTAYENKGKRALDLSALVGLSQTQYDELEPIQWPVSADAPYGTKRLFADGKFYTASGKAQFIAVTPKVAEQQTSENYPYILNSGRLRDHWHTMTRTGKAADLCQHEPHSFVSVHPDDAKTLHVSEGDIMSLSSRGNESTPVLLPVKLDKKCRKGEMFAPIHFTQQFGSANSIARLYSDANDPISGQPELKHACIRAEKVTFTQYALLLCSQTLPTSELNACADYWHKTPLQNGVIYSLANYQTQVDWVCQLQTKTNRQGEWTSFKGLDEACMHMTEANTLQVSIFTSASPITLDHAWIDKLMSPTAFSIDVQKELLRLSLVRSTHNVPSKRICSCFKVHEDTIKQAIAAGSDSVSKLGCELQCGTNCGSCKPELAELVSHHEHAILLTSELE